MSARWGDWRSDFWRVLEESVFVEPSGPRTFNPYRDSVAGVDVVGADTIRRENLAAYLDCFDDRPQTLIVAEAPGPWGCRFSGVPITSEAQLVDPGFPISGRVTSTGDRSPHSEYSASIFWRELVHVFPTFLVWNTYPFHPHRDGEPFSIRAPTATEIRMGSGPLGALHALTQPARVLALGRKAEKALSGLSISCTYVRHPSQGGARLFADAMRDLFGR